MAEESFDDRLRALRLQRKMTQARLAAQSGVTLRTYAYWEAGEHAPGIQELDSLVRALGLTPQERQAFVALLPPAKIGRIVRTVPDRGDILAPPGTGDLIRALRWRKRMSRDALALALGVHRSTVARWEDAHTVPGEETRLRLCDALGAFPEERAALLTSPYAAPLWDGAAPALDACREEAERLAREGGREMKPLFDLRAHLLAGTLWHLSARQSEARLPLAQTYAAHGVYACLRGDDAAALDYSNRSLNIIKAEDAPPKATLYHALWASGQARAHRASRNGAEHSLRQTKEWLLRTPPSRTPAFLLMNAATWGLSSGSLHEAQEYGRVANARMERSREISVHVVEGIQLFQANLLVGQGRYEAGLEADRQVSEVSYYRPLMRCLFHTSVFLKMGAKNDADSSLRRAYALIAADQVDFFRKEADSFAAQLERMA